MDELRLQLKQKGLKSFSYKLDMGSYMSCHSKYSFIKQGRE